MCILLHHAFINVIVRSAAIFTREREKGSLNSFTLPENQDHKLLLRIALF